MKGDPSLPNFIQSQPPLVFRRNKNERLDWRKIASLDLEKLIQDSDVETLIEILPEIAFCKAEVEFDSERTDPGFRKVFQLAQLIIEYILYNQTLTTEKSVKVEQKCLELTEENKRYLEDLKNLKEKMAEARKELKKRKDMIASSQNEIMGANKDEYDQCPYCTKKFIASVYLFSHLQRRHQGLPLHPMFGAQQQPLQTFVDFKAQQQQHFIQASIAARPSQMVVESPRKTRTTSAQTQTIGETFTKATTKHNYADVEIESGESDQEMYSPDYGREKIDVTSIVDKYLQQKTSAGEALENLAVPTQNLTGETRKVSSRRISLEESEQNIAKIILDLESQWKTMAEKIHQTGMQELKVELLGEMQKMQETKTNETKVVQEQTREESVKELSPDAIYGKVEEHFQKHENELAELKQHLQNKMEGDLVAIEGKLESQERFWRSKLRQVEDEYHQQVSKLRDEFQASIRQLPVNVIPSSILEKSEAEAKTQFRQEPFDSMTGPPEITMVTTSENVHYVPESPSESRRSVVIVAHKPPKSPASPAKRPITKELVTPPRPRPRARTNITTQPQHPNSITPRVKAALAKINAPPIPMSSSRGTLNHEYEEPNDVIPKSDRVHEFNYSSSDVSTPSDESERRRRNRALNKPIFHLERKPTDMDLIREKVVDSVDKQMKELGLNPEGGQLENNDATGALIDLRNRRRRRERVDPKFLTSRQTAKNKAVVSTNEERFKQNVGHSPPKVKEPNSRSPLVKMLSAVKTQGSTWQKKIRSSLEKRKKAKRTPTKRMPKPGIKTFFSRTSERWKKNPKTPEVPIEETESESESEESETSSEVSSSDEPDYPMLTRSKPILRASPNEKKVVQVEKSPTVLPTVVKPKPPTPRTTPVVRKANPAPPPPRPKSPLNSWDSD